MQEIENELSALLNQAISPIKMSFHFNYDENKDFLCLYSNGVKYKRRQKLPIYQISPLMRVLALKRQIFTDELNNKTLQKTMDSICFILEWTNNSRKIVIFEIDQVSLFNRDLFIEVIERNNAQFLNIFQKLLSPQDKQ